jgi:DNA-binding transcriptional LysR family regulator
MNRIHIEKFDLNLLTVLRAVHDEGSVTKAAERLNVTQSAISHSLRRLRHQLGDPLFVRNGAALSPTAFMKNISGPVKALLTSMEDVLSVGDAFDPRTARRRFTVGMDERLEVHTLPPLVERLIDNAPGIQFRSVRVDPRDVESQLSSGRMDAVVTAAALRGHELASQRVAGDELIVMLRTGHPILRKGRLTLEAYLDSDHIAVTTASELPSDEDLALSRLSRTRRIRLWAQRYAAASTIVSRSDLLLTMPRLYVSVVNVLDNRTVAVPFDVAPMDYYMYWHPSNSLDAGGEWLRRELCRCFSYYTDQPPGFS